MYMPVSQRGTLRKAADDDLAVGVICSDREGHRIRIDRIDRESGLLTYHFINDELRVQEGIQQLPISEFLGMGWYLT